MHVIINAASKHEGLVTHPHGRKVPKNRLRIGDEKERTLLRPVYFSWKGDGSVVEVVVESHIPLSGTKTDTPALVDPVDHESGMEVEANNAAPEVKVPVRFALVRSGSGEDFSTLVNLSPGLYKFRFDVDGTLKTAPEQPVTIEEGAVVNFMEVRGSDNIQTSLEKDDTTPFLMTGSEGAAKVSGGNISSSSRSPTTTLGVQTSGLSPTPPVALPSPNSPRGVYGCIIPPLSEYTKEPPVLPPHLHRSLLNTAPPEVDSTLLPVPQHVMLNHLYCASRRDGVLVLGLTARYKSKFVTTVFYKPVSRSASAVDSPPQDTPMGPLASAASSPAGEISSRTDHHYGFESSSVI